MCEYWERSIQKEHRRPHYRTHLRTRPLGLCSEARGSSRLLPPAPPRAELRVGDWRWWCCGGGEAEA